MKIIVVDDEQHARIRLNEILSSTPDYDVSLFDRSSYALQYAQENVVDVAFLDISMPEMSGIDLAKALKKINPFINVIFCTGFPQYRQDAIDLHASGYLLKPAETEAVQNALENLLHPPVVTKPHFFARTFGSFDFFVDDTPLHFKRSKSKEMFAYLISIRGASATRKELTAAIFGDQYNLQTQNYLSKIYKDLIFTLDSVGAADLVRRSFNTYSVNTSLFACDLYDYDKGDPIAINTYKGEFMSQYEWAIL